MGDLRCVDGSLLSVVAVPCHDRVGSPYEMTLSLARDARPFATVGERCGNRLADLLAQTVRAREDPAQAAAWPDTEDRFPEPPAAGGGFRPGAAEYFTLSAVEHAGRPGNGELRCVLSSTARWVPEPRRAALTGHAAPAWLTPETACLPAWPGRWRLARRAVLEAWGERGTGLRAVLTSTELVVFLDTVLGESGGLVAQSPPPAARRTTPEQPARPGWPAWLHRGRAGDGSSRSHLPGVRAAARGVAIAFGHAPARRGDVRR